MPAKLRIGSAIFCIFTLIFIIISLATSQWMRACFKEKVSISESSSTLVAGSSSSICFHLGLFKLSTDFESSWQKNAQSNPIAQATAAFLIISLLSLVIGLCCIIKTTFFETNKSLKMMLWQKCAVSFVIIAGFSLLIGATIFTVSQNQQTVHNPVNFLKFWLNQDSFLKNDQTASPQLQNISYATNSSLHNVNSTSSNFLNVTIPNNVTLAAAQYNSSQGDTTINPINATSVSLTVASNITYKTINGTNNSITSNKPTTNTTSRKPVNTTASSKLPRTTANNKLVNVTASSKPINTTASSKLPKTTANNKLVNVTASRKPVNTTASSKLPRTTANNKLVNVTASSKPINTTASSKLPRTTANNKLVNVTASSKPINITASSKLPKTTANNKPVNVTTSSEPVNATASSRPTNITTSNMIVTRPIRNKLSNGSLDSVFGPSLFICWAAFISLLITLALTIAALQDMQKTNFEAFITSTA